ncbi:MAG: GGDEF domain-containing protein [Burkholderiaceae bacterium]
MLRRVLLNPIASHHGELQRQAREDELTGAINRRGFLEAAQAGLDRARQCGEPLSLAMLDVDRFKQINDQHGGHAVGDAVLCELVRRVQARARATDLLGRLGGDEFALLLVGDGLTQARALADALLARLQGRADGAWRGTGPRHGPGAVGRPGRPGRAAGARRPRAL